MIEITKKKIILSAMLAFGLSVFSQDKTAPNETKNVSEFSRCSTVEYEKELQEKYPNRLTDEKFEQWLAPKIVAFKKRQATEKMAVTTIPVIFHVFTDCAGADNISVALIQAQLAQLNLDFSNMSNSTEGVAADSEIQFSFAQVDPAGNILPESGINRVSSFGAGPFSRDYVNNTLKSATSWDPDRYMNIWSTDITLLGWAQFPNNSSLGGLDVNGGPANTDGVVVRTSSTGSLANPNPNEPIYNAGRTLTHEVGHWLGLRHLWGDGGCAIDDFCADTPNCDGQYYGSGPAPTECGNLRMISNYMDYTDDIAMNTFTTDQKVRMQTVLSMSPRRNTLGASTVDNPVGPVVYFDKCIQSINVTEGSACSYQDVSIAVGKSKTSSGSETVTVSRSGTATDNVDYIIQTPSLTFAASSTAKQNMVVRVFNDGFVEADETIILDLNVSTSGNSSTTNIANQITISIINDDAPRSTGGLTEVFVEDFESHTDFEIGNIGGWTMNDGDGLAPYTIGAPIDFPNEGAVGTFIVFNPSQVTGGTLNATWDAHGGDKYYACFSANPGNNDHVITPQITLNNGTGSQLKFWAKSQTADFGLERFNVKVSNTNANLASFTTIQPSSHAAATPQLAPDSWTEYTYDLSAYDGGNIYIAFHDVSTDSYVFMLDDISVTTNVDLQPEIVVHTAQQSNVMASGSVFVNNGSNYVLDITNNNNVNYGCVDANVSRASGTSVMYQVAGNVNYVMGKTYAIAPGTIQAGGNAILKFYFTEAEILEWETTTGNSRNELAIIKDNGSSETVAAAIGAFGSDVTLSGTFASGINGTYYFGKQEAVLGVAENQFNLFNLYPNPSSDGIFNLSVSTTDDARVKLFDIRGRNVYSELHTNNSNVFKTTLDFSKLASGVYMLDVESDFKRAVKKIVIQ